MIQPETVRVEGKSLLLVFGEVGAGSELGLDVEAGLGLVIGNRFGNT